MNINSSRYSHLGRPEGVGEDASLLTNEQVEILEDQIQKNKLRIGEQVSFIDRLVNIEGYSKNHPKVEVIRVYMQILMDENNTFRQNLWCHWLTLETTSFYY